MKTSVFRIEKMDCPTEERLIRNRLDGVNGIDRLDFNLIGRTLTVSYSGIEESAIVAAIGALGMEAVPQPEGPRRIELPVVDGSFWRKPGTVLTMIAGVTATLAEILALSGFGETSLLVRALAVTAIVTGGYETAAK